VARESDERSHSSDHDRIHATPDRIHAIRARIHCDPDRIQETPDRIHCPPDEKQAIRDRFDPIRGRMNVTADHIKAKTHRDQATAVRFGLVAPPERILAFRPSTFKE
jgi:hypothetical protein